MEENITQRKTNTVTLAIYSDATQYKGLIETIKQFNTSKKGPELSFAFYDINDINVKSPGENLVITTIDVSAYKPAINTLKKSGTPVVISEPEGIITIINELQIAIDMGFSIKDFAQIKANGIAIEDIKKQLAIFRNGIEKIVLYKPATIGNGIYPLTKKDAIEHAEFFDSKKDSYKLKKFVPASGAASRMFKFLCEFVAEYDPEKESLNAYINRKKDNSLKVFLVGIDKFPFFKEVLEETRKNPEYIEWSKELRYYHFIKTMLSPGKFDYANKPKGILPFHQYNDFIATPIYEHFKECAAYASSNNKAHVHFTISEDHLDSFLDFIRDVKEDIEKESGVGINFSFSYQHKETDTIAVDNKNEPFRNDDGSLLFRPGGHGALIENLNRLEADIVCIKNIDNVSHNNIHTIALYKKALMGILIKLREHVFSYLEKLDDKIVNEADIKEMLAFAKDKLFITISPDIEKFTLAGKIEYTRDILNRPLRVCGMVKNEGEPGGGPFWVKEDGKLSLQIVESSQIDLDNKKQKTILSNSTHFNPVDLVCSLKDYKGNSFDLKQFVDPNTGFIVHKNKMGRDVKSYELPGLWNGAMAEWITVFVEVPLETFNPVKTVNDLLKPAHQHQ